MSVLLLHTLEWFCWNLYAIVASQCLFQAASISVLVQLNCVVAHLFKRAQSNHTIHTNWASGVKHAWAQCRSPGVSWPQDFNLQYAILGCVALFYELPVLQHAYVQSLKQGIAHILALDWLNHHRWLRHTYH